MDKRLENLNRFVAGMLDINLSRNPLAQNIKLVFNTVERDHYQDAVTVEECTLEKLAMVKKDLDMNYIQEFGEDLVEDTDSLPWLVSLTTTGLPRQPRMDDQVVISGTKFTVSMVKPINREIESVIILMVYPERTE